MILDLFPSLKRKRRDAFAYASGSETLQSQQEIRHE